ncbi:MAG: alpha/beta hydrolase [Terracoccus sp.]
MTAIRNGLREPESWSDLVEALHAAVDGDGTYLADFAASSVYRDDDGTYTSPGFAKDNLPVTCADWPPSVWDDAWPSADVRKNHPLWARVALATVPECVGWKGTLRQNLLVGAELPTPVLVIGNEGDPVTPIEDTEAMSNALLRSRFVSVDAEGHGAYGSSNDCADRFVDDYLTDTVPPAEGFTCPSS